MTTVIISKAIDKKDRHTVGMELSGSAEPVRDKEPHEMTRSEWCTSGPDRWRKNFMPRLQNEHAGAVRALAAVPKANKQIFAGAQDEVERAAFKVDSLQNAKGYEAIPHFLGTRKTPADYRVMDRIAHEGFVADALKEGKRVPAHVLADYPHLQSVKKAIDKKDRHTAGMSFDAPEANPGRSDAQNAIHHPNFLKWFGDWRKHDGQHSAVLNAKTGEPQVTHGDGSPKVVYHGTAHGGFQSFEDAKTNPNSLYGPGHYFTEDPEIAHSYTEKDAKYSIPNFAADKAHKYIMASEEPGEVKSVYMNIRKPMRVDEPLTEEHAQRIGDALDTHYEQRPYDGGTLKGKKPSEYLKQMAKQSASVNAAQTGGSSIVGGQDHNISVEDALHKVGNNVVGEKTDRGYRPLGNTHWPALFEKAGYDGITHVGGKQWRAGGKEHRVWIAFHGKQVKHTENNGDFNPNTDDMYKAINRHDKNTVGMSFDEEPQGAIVPASYAVKQPHELTQSEYHLAHASRSVRSNTMIHLKHVQNALNSGLSVPAHVMHDYPHLLNAPQAPSAPKPITVHVRRTKKVQAGHTLNMQFEDLHPRGDVETVNPKTGKTIKPGQFAPKPEGTDDNDNIGSLGTGVPQESASVSPEPVSGTGKRKQSPNRRKTRAGTGEANGSTLDLFGDEPGRSASASATDVHPPAIGDGSEGHSPKPVRGLELQDAEEEAQTGVVSPYLHLFNAPDKAQNNYRITDSDHLGEGGLKAKFRDNVTAIRLLKQLESEGRMATPAEQAILVKYTGWGWAQVILDRSNDYAWNKSDWKPEYQELKRLLSEEELASVRATLLNAHYTSQEVVQSVWNAVAHLGFQGGKVLEPGCGVGNFLGLMPSALWVRSQVTGVEIDPLTGGIARQLYQDADIRIEPMEQANLNDDFYDLAIGNVPFGNFDVFDKDYDRPGSKFLTSSIHNYFFAKSLDKVRPGGLVALITSRYTMDAPSSENLRNWLSERADFVGAVRLPNTAFKQNAGTEVVTDVIFLRKQSVKDNLAGEAWGKIGNVSTADGRNVFVNTYYEHHPDMMLGKVELKHGMYRADEPTLESDGRNIGTAFAQAISQLPANVLYAEPNPATLPNAAAEHIMPPAHVKEGGYAMDGDTLMQNSAGSMVVCDAKGVLRDRIVGMAQIRDTARVLLREQVRPNTNEENLRSYRKELNRVYDAFVAVHGRLNDKPNLRAFADDPDLDLLCGLEIKKDDEWSKHDLFRKRTVGSRAEVTTAGSSQEAMLHSLADMNGLNWERMASLTGKTPSALQTELWSQGIVFKNPTGDWETADGYLSGDVRVKLKAAQSAAKLDKRYEINADRLQAVQPIDVEPANICVQLGSPWIPSHYYADFMNETLGLTGYRSQPFSVAYNPHTASFTVEKGDMNDTLVYSKWGTPKVGANKLIECALNGTTPTVWMAHPTEYGKKILDAKATEAAQNKMMAVKDEFNRWLFKDESRSQDLGQIYNEQFNNLRTRKFDGQHLELPGLSDAFRARLKDHVKDGVWRILQTPNTLLAHAVGAGKTATITASCMEMRRLGLARKPMIVVPNHLVSQWTNEVQTMYPGANILMTTSDDFTAKNRRRLMTRIAAGDWDAVIVAHTSFGKLPVTKKWEEEFTNQQIGQLESYLTGLKRDSDQKRSQRGGGSGNGKKTEKDIQKSIKRMKARLQKRLNIKGRDELIPFEQLGIDHVSVDEAHAYKNLYYHTKMGNVKGLPNSDSNRSWDMLLKTRYVQKLNNGRGVTFATGTPIANTMAEMYTMMRYLMPDELEKRGLQHFDAWANTFGRVQRSVELGVDGRYMTTKRFGKIINVPELSALWQVVADVKTAKDLKLPIPTVQTGGRIAHESLASPVQLAYMHSLGVRADNIRGVNGSDNRPLPSEDNMLKVCSDGRKCSLDYRLLDPTAPDDPNSKVNMCVREVHKIWQDTQNKHSTQVVFLDMGTPKAQSAASLQRQEDAAEQAAAEEGSEQLGEDAAEQEFTQTVYADMRAKLHKMGIPPNEVAFIHDAKTQAQKLELFQKMNDGKVRVLVGSTEKMGTGMNAQNKMIALHHIDCPWRPCDLVQREGRLLRQGNENEEVGLHVYGSKGSPEQSSFDAFQWDKIQKKEETFNQIMKGETTDRETDDMDLSISAGELSAHFSGSPLQAEKQNIESELRQLSTLAQYHRQSENDKQHQMFTLPPEIASAKASVEKWRGLAAYRDKNKPEKFVFHTQDGIFDNADEAGKALYARTLTVPAGETRDLGEYAGFKVDVSASKSWQGEDRTFTLTPSVGGHSTQTERHIDSLTPGSIIPMIQGALRTLDKTAQGAADNLERKEQSLSALYETAEEPFEHLPRMHKLETRLKEIEKELGIGEDEHIGAEEGEESDEVVGKSVIVCVRLSPHGSIRKAIVYNRKTGESSGQASWRGGISLNPAATRVAALPRLAQPVKDRIASVNVAAGMVRGLSRTDFTHTKTPNLSAETGRIGIDHTFHHAFAAVDAGGAAAQMANNLRGTHSVSPASVTSVKDASGANRRVHSFTATSLAHGGTHQVSVTERPAAIERGAMAASGAADKAGAKVSAGLKKLPSVGSIPAGVASSVSKVATAVAVRITHPKAPAVTSADDATHMAGMQAQGAQSGLSHVTSQVNKTGMFGRGEKRYSHWFNHRNPLIKAREMKTSLQAQGHGVSSVQQRRVYVDGKVRHQYSFNVRDKDTGKIHTVSAFRPAA